MVSPVPPVRQFQQIQRQTVPFNGDERIVYLDGGSNVGGNYQGINTHTQVVAANQGLRMTSLQPDFRMPKPINIQSKNVANIPPNNMIDFYQNIAKPSGNISLQRQHQKLPSPVASPHKQIAIRNHCQLVPNIALPYCPLPRLKARISASDNGIILTWDYESSDNMEMYKVECYQLFAHQAREARAYPPPDISQWKKIGVVNALPLPMACTLTQFSTGNMYYFAVLAVDIHGREGEMSNPCIIRLNLSR